MKDYSYIIVGVLITIIVGSLYIRYTQIPSKLCVSTRLYLYRLPDYSSGSIQKVSLKLVSTQIESDNITLDRGLNESIKTDAHWRLIIIANESTSTNFEWEYEILPTFERIGDYSGVIMKSFDAQGQFTLWVILNVIYEDKEEMYRSFSERVEI